MAVPALVIASLLLSRATAAPPGSNASQLYGSLNDQEKEYFIRYQLGKAVETQHSPRLPGNVEVEPAVVIPDDIKQKITDVSSRLQPDFPSRLYELVTRQYSLSYKEVRTLVRAGVVCNARGDCFYPKDVGSSCCPF